MCSCPISNIVSHALTSLTTPGRQCHERKTLICAWIHPVLRTRAGEDLPMVGLPNTRQRLIQHCVFKGRKGEVTGRAWD